MLLRVICTDQSLVTGPGLLAASKSYSVGRSSRCAFVLNDRSVSRRHADLIASEETLLVKDRKSRNGTYVDGLKIVEAEVQVGQLIRFGNACFRLIANDQPEGNEDSTMSTFLMTARSAQEQAALGLLSQTQRRVLELLLTGLSEKEVATRLELTYNTVHSHVKEIYLRMGINSRPELFALFVSDAKKKPLGK